MVAIFVIFTIVAFILIDALVQRSEFGKRAKLSNAPVIAKWTYTVPPEMMTLPGGTYLDSGHTWLSLNVDGSTTVGIDAFARYAMGTPQKIVLPEVGMAFRRGDDLFTINQGKRKAVFRAPIDGVVEAVHEPAAKSSAVEREDPYHEGWLCSLRPTNLATNLRKMLIAEEALAWLRSETIRFQEFIQIRSMENAAFGLVLQDGGEVTRGALAMMDNETWDKFAREFLQTEGPKMSIS
ncbi:MAG: hypothetical protein U0V70_02010 [Terriglobia bacterium]